MADCRRALRSSLVRSCGPPATPRRSNAHPVYPTTARARRAASRAPRRRAARQQDQEDREERRRRRSALAAQPDGARKGALRLR